MEPSVVLGGNGGFGFLIGPTLMQTMNEINSIPVTVSVKYHYMHFDDWGHEQALLVEVARQIMIGHFLVGIGGEIGVGLNSVISTENGSGSRNKAKILGTRNGVIFGLVFDIGFCL
jgi:hypothetical protein